MALVVIIAIVVGAVQYYRTRQVREALYAAFTPIEITNCEMQRFGPIHDGGYLLCGNLLQEVKSAYSYGIAGYDPWGCVAMDILKVPLHQYDCFDPTVPRCTGAPSGMFHNECIGPKKETIDGRPYDSLGSQIAANGDAGKHLVVKMDVEGSEWESLLAAPDDVLNAIDQLTIEFHDIEDPRYLQTAARLNQFFYTAHTHQNNYACLPGFDPFPGPIFEALLVNKRIAKANPSVVTRGVLPSDSPNSPITPDCQASPAGGEPSRIARWVSRNARVVGYKVFGIPFS